MRTFEIKIATRYEQCDAAVKYHLVRYLAAVPRLGAFQLSVKYDDRNMEYWKTEHFWSCDDMRQIGLVRTGAIGDAIRQALAEVRVTCRIP